MTDQSQSARENAQAFLVYRATDPSVCGFALFNAGWLAALSHTTQGEVEAKLVPLEPTEPMLRAGAAELYTSSGGDFDATGEEIADAYKAMLGAFHLQSAPVVEAQPVAQSATAAVPNLPMYGNLPWATVRAYVQAATGAPPIIDSEYEIGHQVVCINFNSLNRIMSAVLALADPAVQAAQVDSDTVYAVMADGERVAIASLRENAEHAARSEPGSMVIPCRLVPIDAPAVPSEPRAWAHEDEEDRVISQAQKAQALRDGGASASSVKPYSIALYLAAPAVQPRNERMDDVVKAIHGSSEFSFESACKVVDACISTPPAESAPCGTCGGRGFIVTATNRDEDTQEACPECNAQPAPEAGNPMASSFAEVFAELDRATKKFPTWPTDPLHALAVLGEEFGELTKDMLQMVYEPHKTNAENVRKEALQTAAMALRLFASLDRYEYTPGQQHSQSAPSAADGARTGAQVISDEPPWVTAMIDDRRKRYALDQSCTPAFLQWLDTMTPREGVGANEAWNAGVEWQKTQGPQPPVDGAQERDAARYRWLRLAPICIAWPAFPRGDELDAAIDDALSAGKGEAS